MGKAVAGDRIVVCGPLSCVVNPRYSFSGGRGPLGLLGIHPAVEDGFGSYAQMLRVLQQSAACTCTPDLLYQEGGHGRE